MLSVSRFLKAMKNHRDDGTLGNRNFFCWGVFERGWRGVRSYLKLSSTFNKKNEKKIWSPKVNECQYSFLQNFKKNIQNFKFLWEFGTVKNGKIENHEHTITVSENIFDWTKCASYYSAFGIQLFGLLRWFQVYNFFFLEKK